jgi:hypothetical protein
MTVTWAVVYIFSMFFFVIFVGIRSHHDLEMSRIARGIYDGTDDDATTTKPEVPGE